MTSSEELDKELDAILEQYSHRWALAFEDYLETVEEEKLDTLQKNAHSEAKRAFNDILARERREGAIGEIEGELTAYKQATGIDRDLYIDYLNSRLVELCPPTKENE